MAIIGGVATVITVIPLGNMPSSGPAIVTDQLIRRDRSVFSVKPGASGVSRTG